ncbi:MAG: hypothetical protein AB1726_08510 [Planctomycetota bacterium]
MARAQNKAGGPTRGRRQVHKIGMGSGQAVRKARAARKRGKRG